MSPDQMLEIKRLVECGLATARIAKKLSLSKGEVSELIKTNNWQLKKETKRDKRGEAFDDTKIREIYELYEMGVSAKTLGQKYSIDKRRIQKWVDERGGLRRKNESHRITHFNEHKFDIIDTVEKAYWFGFLYTHGINYLPTNTFSVQLKRSDRDHLINLAKFVDLAEDSVTDFTAKIKGKEYPAVVFKMYSKHVCEQMTELGIYQNKSLIIQYPEWLGDHLNRHFIRGLYDSNGGVRMNEKRREWKWYICSTEEMCQTIQKIIENALGLRVSYYYISKIGNNTYQLESGGNQKILKIMKWMYARSAEETRLFRKYERFCILREGWERK